MENCRSYFADWKEHRRELTPMQQELAERIRKAFAGVTCGESLGYMSGFAEEDYCADDIIKAFKEREPRMYWPAITPDWLFGLDECLCYVEPEGFRFLLPAQRDGVRDYVNEKRLEELREEIRTDWSRSVWKHLLPWEKAALPPDTDEKRAAEEILCAYMEKHGIEI